MAMIGRVELLRRALAPFADLIYPQRASGEYPILSPLPGRPAITVSHVEAARRALEQTIDRVPFAGQEPDAPQWRDDPENAPYGEWVLTFGQGGLTIKMLDDHGQWRGRSGLSDQKPGELGRPKAPPTHWMLLPNPPFDPLVAGSPGKPRAERKKRNAEGLSGAI